MPEKTFADYETEGWQRNASAYEKFDLPLTSQAFGPILDSLHDIDGQRVLELACGTGHLAAEAVARGAQVVGVDAASKMVEIAKKIAPTGATFDVGSADALSFEDSSFDAVMSSFGFLHFADPELALKEANRVLKPGGKLSLTVWQAPDKGNEFFGLIFATIMKHGNMEVGLPPAPDTFAIAKPEVATPMLTASGFDEITYDQIPVFQPISGPQTAFDFIVNGGVRSRMIFERQTEQVQEQIKQVLAEAVSRYIEAGDKGIPSPAVLVRARKPHA